MFHQRLTTYIPATLEFFSDDPGRISKNGLPIFPVLDLHCLKRNPKRPFSSLEYLGRNCYGYVNLRAAKPVRLELGVKEKINPDFFL